MSGMVRGGKGAFVADNAAGVPTQLTPWMDNCDWGARTKETLDTTVWGQSTKTFASGLGEGTVSITGKYDAAVGGPDAILEALLDADLPLTIEWQPEGPGAGKPFKRVEAILNDYATSAPVGGIVTFAATWQASGAFTRGVLA